MCTLLLFVVCKNVQQFYDEKLSLMKHLCLFLCHTIYIYLVHRQDLPTEPKSYIPDTVIACYHPLVVGCGTDRNLPKNESKRHGEYFFIKVLSVIWVHHADVCMQLGTRTLTSEQHHQHNIS